MSRVFLLRYPWWFGRFMNWLTNFRACHQEKVIRLIEYVKIFKISASLIFSSEKWQIFQLESDMKKQYQECFERVMLRYFS